MYRALIIFLFLSLSLNISATEETTSDPSPQYMEETASEHSSQYKETARISWKFGFSASWNIEESNVSLYPIPILMELQIPIANPKLKWLTQVGGGLMIQLKTETICDPDHIPDPPGAPFNSDFFQEIYEERRAKATNIETCFFTERTFDRQYIPYFTGKTGFQYGSDVYGALQGGVIFSIEGDIGWTGELLIGKKLGLDVSGGIKIVSFKDSLYVGAVIYLGNIIKNWWAEQ